MSELEAHLVTMLRYVLRSGLTAEAVRRIVERVISEQGAPDGR